MYELVEEGLEGFMMNQEFRGLLQELSTLELHEGWGEGGKWGLLFRERLKGFFLFFCSACPIPCETFQPSNLCRADVRPRGSRRRAGQHLNPSVPCCCE